MSKKWNRRKRGLEFPERESFPGLCPSSEDEDWVDEDAANNHSVDQHSEQESATSSSISEALKIPTVTDGLFEVEMKRLSNIADPQHIPGVECDGAYCIPAGGKRCFRDDNSGHERIEPEALMFVLGMFESLSRPTMLKAIESMDPVEKKLVKTRYANNVSTITRRVRQRLARIYVPKKYSKGIDAINDTDRCNRGYITEIKRCENITEKLVPEVGRLQEKLDLVNNEKEVLVKRLQNNGKISDVHPLLQFRVKTFMSQSKPCASSAFKSSLEKLFDSAADDSATFTGDYAAKKTSIPLEDVISNLVSPYDNVVKYEVDGSVSGKSCEHAGDVHEREA